MVLFIILIGRGFRIASSPADAAEISDFIVLSVKPQNYFDVLGNIKESGISLAGKVFISLGAGITSDSVCRCLGADAAVVRTMPNTPMLIGYGVTALCPNKFVSNEDFSKVEAIFASRGATMRLPEEMMNPVISVTSSSPAYIYLMIDAMLSGAKAEGADDPKMLEMICRTVIGSAEMVLKSGKTPEELIRMVKSPKGTTEQALNALSEHGFSEAVADAMHRCTLRAEELSAEFTSKTEM